MNKCCIVFKPPGVNLFLVNINALLSCERGKYTSRVFWGSRHTGADNQLSTFFIPGCYGNKNQHREQLHLSPLAPLLGWRSVCELNVMGWIESLHTALLHASAPALVVLLLDLQEQLTWRDRQETLVQRGPR